MHLREQAAEAYRQHLEQERQDQEYVRRLRNEEYRDKLTRLFRHDLGEAPDQVDPETGRVTYQDLAFQYDQVDGCWRLFHEEDSSTYYSGPIADLISLGKQLAEWDWHDQVIEVEEVDETPEAQADKIVRLLRDLAEEVLYL